MIKEQVFIIGAQRCGTTYLNKVLDSHPEIQLTRPVRPEPKFFLNESEFQKGREYYENKYFSALPSQVKVIGEKGTSYIEHPVVIQRIQDFYPQAKVLVVLRNPVERALSNYFFSHENGLETRSIDEVFLKQTPPPPLKIQTSVAPFDYLERGIYHHYLKPYTQKFKNKIKIILFDELFSRAETYIEVYDFLNVQNSFVSEHMNKKINPTLSRENSVIDPEIYRKLTAYFEPHNKALEQFLGRKTNW